jgi:hypothetical protein
LHGAIDDDPLELARAHGLGLYGGVDGRLEQFFDTRFADGGAKAADLGGIARQLRGVVVQTAEVLPDDILGPAGDEFFVAEVEGVLEVEQCGHEPYRQAGAAGGTGAAAGHLQCRPEEVVAFDDGAFATLASESGGKNRFQLGPGHPARQDHQRVPKVNHLIQPGAEKVVSSHLNFAQFLSGFGYLYSNFSGISMGEFWAQTQCL